MRFNMIGHEQPFQKISAGRLSIEATRKKQFESFAVLRQGASWGSDEACSPGGEVKTKVT